MTRQIQHTDYTLALETPADPIQALDIQAASGKFQYLLAHAEDGVIWGKVENSELTLSSDAFPDVSPGLRLETLRELRLFGENTEWFAWHSEDGWRARLLQDAKGKEAQYFDEPYILWGNRQIEAKPPFTLLEESNTGIQHAPPVNYGSTRRVKLVMRHYLDYDEAGAVYVKLSRLVTLDNGGQK